MKTRTFGTDGPEVPIVGLGTWNMEQDDPEAAAAAIHRALDLGMTHVDTAEMYGSGRVEDLLGEALRGRRDEVFLVSKVLPGNASKDGVQRACERSLERLGTDRLDAYLLHWPGSHPLEETIAGFEALLEAGKIRSYGVSNFDVEDLEAAVRIAGPGKIACNQVLYHLEQRDIERRLLRRCQDLGVALVGYSPLGSGRFVRGNSHSGLALMEVAQRRGVTAQAAALAFLTREAGTFTIPKTSNPDHVEANATAGDLALTGDDVNRLDTAFPVPRTDRGLPML